MKASILLLSFMFCLACGGQTGVEEEAAAPEPSPESQFDGAWEFVHLVTPDGASTTQRGHMVVSSDCVCFVRVGKEREGINADDSDEAKVEKAANLYDSVRATCGTFTIEGDSLKATWLTSADPSVEGNTSEFILGIEGDTVSLAPAAAPQFKFVHRRIQ
jgi:hypothetical protein